MRILLAAEESAGARSLLAVLNSSHELTGVLTSSADSAVGREAVRNGIPVLPAKSLKDPAFAVELSRQPVDVLLNVHSLYVIRPEILGCFSFGCFNLHPGPLPDYAGMNAPSWALLNGEPQHGVTLHWITAGIDEGYIAYQELFRLSEGDTGLSVSMRCITLGLDLVTRLLDTLSSDPASVPRTAQDLSQRRYFGRQKPHGGRVPPEMTAVDLHRFVRASDYSPFASPWGPPLVHAGGREVGLVNVALTGVESDQPAGTLAARDGQVWLAASDEWVVLRRVTSGGRAGDPAVLLLSPGEESA